MGTSRSRSVAATMFLLLLLVMSQVLGLLPHLRVLTAVLGQTWQMMTILMPYVKLLPLCWRPGQTSATPWASSLLYLSLWPSCLPRSWTLQPTLNVLVLRRLWKMLLGRSAPPARRWSRRGPKASGCASNWMRLRIIYVLLSSNIGKLNNNVLRLIGRVATSTLRFGRRPSRWSCGRRRQDANALHEYLVQPPKVALMSLALQLQRAGQKCRLEHLMLQRRLR